MRRFRHLLLAMFALMLVALPALSQAPRTAPPRPKGPPPPTGPRLIPVAETKLLMDGITQPNFQALDKTLKADQVDAEGWTFARGQSLLIAEAGNLLMLRPPNNTGQDAWMKAAGDLRENAAQLAKTVANRDLAESRLALTRVAGACNNCHQTFRIETKVKVFEDAKP